MCVVVMCYVDRLKVIGNDDSRCWCCGCVLQGRPWEVVVEGGGVCVCVCVLWWCWHAWVWLWCWTWCTMIPTEHHNCTYLLNINLSSRNLMHKTKRPHGCSISATTQRLIQIHSQQQAGVCVVSFPCSSKVFYRVSWSRS